MSDVETPLRLKRGESTDPKGDRLRAKIKLTSYDSDPPQTVIPTRVKRVEERKYQSYVSGFGESAMFMEQNLGWYVTFEGSWEALYFGSAKPWLSEGEEVEIVIRRPTDALPQ